MEYMNKKPTLALIAVVVCLLIFVACLPIAYKTTPKTPAENQNTAEVTVDDVADSEEERSSDNAVNEEKSSDGVEMIEELDVHNVNKQRPYEPESMEVIEEEDVFIKAKNMRNEGKYESAVYEYQQAAKNSTDSEYQAKCYEEIAMTYGSMKRYGSALAYAQKAYSNAPSQEREILLARLYYKTGQTDKAAARVNAILKRDFN